MSKHTPGPWQQHDQEYCPLEIFGALDLEDGKVRGVMVCEIITTDDLGTDHANARLVAAAPELLADCQRRHLHLVGRVAAGVPPITEIEHDDYVRLCRVLAKVEGHS